MTSNLGVELPHRWAGNEYWKDIEIDNGEVSYNAIGRPLYRQCEFRSGFPAVLNIPQCGGEGHYLITRTSALTGTTYTDYACLYHAKMWINPNA